MSSRRATDSEVENEAPTKEEVKQALLKLKNNGLQDLILEVDEPELADKLQIIMEQVWITKEMPIEWEEGTVCLPYTQEGGPIRMW
jgi:hypothetical protein